jgi:hypothetical protein
MLRIEKKNRQETTPVCARIKNSKRGRPLNYAMSKRNKPPAKNPGLRSALHCSEHTQL